jgi:glycosyltransferase involved in cell wall biosynthesis
MESDSKVVRPGFERADSSVETTGSDRKLLAVCLITYNQASYIEQAIDGIIMQRVDFPWELIIADDFSTDGTREIVSKYKDRYPDLIRLILQKSNVGAERNWLDLILTPNTKYIAYCEGDDYWTDPCKLQKQVKFMEENRDFGMVYCKARRKVESGAGYWDGEIGAAFRAVADLLITNPIPTLTVLMRTELYHRYLTEVRPQTRAWRMGDYPGWLWIAFNSKIYFMPEVMGVYRVVSGSASYAKSPEKRLAFFLSAFDAADYFSKQYCSAAEYKEFIERRWLWCYMFCVKYNMADKRIYIRRLKDLNGLGWRTTMVIYFGYHLGLSYVIHCLHRYVFRGLYRENRGLEWLWRR